MHHALQDKLHLMGLLCNVFTQKCIDKLSSVTLKADVAIATLFKTAVYISHSIVNTSIIFSWPIGQNVLFRFFQWLILKNQCYEKNEIECKTEKLFRD